MKQHFILLDRNLFYTALTRGKRMVVLVGTQTAMEMAIGRQRAHQRYSSCAARLADSLSDVVDAVAVKQMHFGGV